MMQLIKYDVRYAKAFAEAKSAPEVRDNGYDRNSNPINEVEALELIKSQITKEPTERFFILWNGEFAGEIGISKKCDVFRQNAEIGYFISKKFWGNGIATKALKQMTQYAFESFDIVRIVAGVFNFNKASMRVLEKNDYYLESIRKNAVTKNNKIIDDYIWVKLRKSTKSSPISA